MLVPYPAESPADQALIDPFREGLRELGYVEGQNLVLEYRFSSGPNQRLPELAAELVRLPVDVIVAETHEPLLAAKRATSTIPIVMSSHADPVGAGLVASLGRPGGNVTGLTSSAATTTGKKLELLQEVSPGISRVVVFSNHSLSGGAQRSVQEAEVGAEALGLTLLSLDVRSPADFPPAFEVAVRERADALYALADPLTISQRGPIIEFAARNGLAAVYNEKSWVEAGGLMSYGPDFSANRRRAAYYVDRILKGTQPADLPIEQPMRFELVLNLKTAQALGLTIPQQVLAQATDVIQ